MDDSYNNSNYLSINSDASQYVKLQFPAEKGKKLYYYFNNQEKTNTLDIPSPAVPFEWVWMSDAHNNGYAIFRRIHSNEKPAFILYGGDMVPSGYKTADWDTTISMFKILNTNTFMMSEIGNHEEETPLYSLITGMPLWYSFKWSNTYYIALDNTLSIVPGSHQYTWLEEELKKARKFDFRVVYFHIPPYSTLKHGDNPEAKEILVPLFDKYKVQLVLNGHDHGYQVSYPLSNGQKVTKGGTTYVVSGGSGVVMYDKITNGDWLRLHLKSQNYLKLKTEKDRISVQAIDQSNKVIDQFEILK